METQIHHITARIVIKTWKTEPDIVSHFDLLWTGNQVWYPRMHCHCHHNHMIGPKIVVTWLQPESRDLYCNHETYFAPNTSTHLQISHRHVQPAISSRFCATIWIITVIIVWRANLWTHWSPVHSLLPSDCLKENSYTDEIQWNTS